MKNHYQDLQVNSALEGLIKRLDGGESIFAHVYGRAGTGKSVGVAQILSRLQDGASSIALHLHPDRLNVFASKGIKSVDISKFSDSYKLEFKGPEFIEGVLAASNPSIIVIDEVQLGDKNIYDYFYELIKTRRKRNLSIIYISQSLDVMGDRFIENTDFIFQAIRVNSTYQIKPHDCAEEEPIAPAEIFPSNSVLH